MACALCSGVQTMWCSECGASRGASESERERCIGGVRVRGGCQRSPIPSSPPTQYALSLSPAFRLTRVDSIDRPSSPTIIRTSLFTPWWVALAWTLGSNMSHFRTRHFRPTLRLGLSRPSTPREMMQQAEWKTFFLCITFRIYFYPPPPPTYCT